MGSHTPTVPVVGQALAQECDTYVSLCAITDSEIKCASTGERPWGSPLPAGPDMTREFFLDLYESKPINKWWVKWPHEGDPQETTLSAS